MMLKTKSMLTFIVAAIVGLSAVTVQAQEATGLGTIAGERYVPTIWVDPDGCEHWVMDDGSEGYMTPHVTPDGKPVCRPGTMCGVLETDQFFATNQSYISAAGKTRLQAFFNSNAANTRSFVIAGHTDSRASDEYNLRLSERRAAAVAKVGKSVGARISDVRGYGERDPRVPNRGAVNMAKNRRVEIYCLR